jgi:hypothetical protein
MTSSRPVLAHTLALALTIPLAGCLVHERDPIDGDAGVVDHEDAAPGPDGWSPPDTGWCECPAPPPGCVYDGTPCGCSHMTCAPPVHCGRDVCTGGLVCCNASCGLCAGPGADCPEIACAPDCTPQDAHSGGRCAGDAGWAWDGSACRAIACRCVGSECDAAFATEADCLSYFGTCPPVDPPADCAADDATGTGGCDAVLGYAFGAHGCLPISGCSCVGADCGVVVGRSETDCNALHGDCPILFL